MNRIFFLSILMPLLVTGFIYGMYVYNESELLTKVSQRTKTVAVFMLYIVQELLVIFISDKLVGMICFQYTLGVSAFMLSRKYAGLLILTTPVITNLYLFFSGRDSILSLVLGLVSIYVTLVGMHVIKRRLLFQDLLQYFIILMLANVIPIHRLGQKNVDILSEFYDKNDVVWIALGTCLIFFLTFLLLREVDLKRKRIARLVYEESHDKLTGMRNYRQFRRELDRIEERGSLAYIALMLDIDNFKLINDTYGHTEGNAVLKFFATELRKWRKYVQNETGKRIKLFRFGGEEFFVLIENMEIDDVFERIEQFKNEFNHQNFVTEDGQQLKISFSGGLSDARETTSIRLAVKDADEALYVAKNSGKKRVVKRRQKSLVVNSKDLRPHYSEQEKVQD